MAKILSGTERSIGIVRSAKGRAIRHAEKSSPAFTFDPSKKYVRALRHCHKQAPKESVLASGHGRKGQMFIIAAIFMIVGVILLRNILSLPAITQEKAFQDISYLDRNLNNIKNEFTYIAGAVSVQPVPNGSVNYLSNFSDYIRGQFDSKIFYVFVFANGTTHNISVTVGNYLQNNISGVINLTDSTPAGQIFNLNDKSYVTIGFNTSQTLLNLTINYTLQDRETVEKLYVNSSTRNHIAAIFDITLQDTGVMLRSKSAYNRTW